MTHSVKIDISLYLRRHAYIGFEADFRSIRPNVKDEQQLILILLSSHGQMINSSSTTKTIY